MSNFTRVAVLIIVLFTPYSISAANYTLPNNPLPGCSLNNETDTYTCPNGLTLGFEDRLQVTGNRNVTINVTGDMNLGTRVRLNPNGQPDQLTIDTTGSFRGGYNNEINANISSGGSLRIDNETPVQGSLIAQTDLTLGFRSSLDGSATSLAGNVNTENEVQVSGDLSAAGNIVLAFRSEVAGNLSSGGNVSLQNEVELTGNVDAGGFVSLNFRSQVTGNIASGEDVTLQREVTVDGNVNSPGTVYVPDSSRVTGYVNAPEIIDEDNVQGETCDINDNIGPCSGSPGTPTIEPIGYWYFDELNWNGNTGEVVDQSGNSYNGQALRNASTSGFSPAIDADLGTCRYGKFSGDNVVQVPNATEITQADSISIAFWFKGDASLQNQSESYQTLLIVGDGPTESSAGRFEVYRQDTSDGGGIYFEIRLRNGAIVNVEAGNQLEGGTQLLDDTWHHVAATYSRDDRRLQIFIDGNLVDQRSFNGNRNLNSVSDNLFIGGQSTASNSFYGELDEVFISDGVMSTDDVLNLMLTTRPCADTRPQCLEVWPQGFSPLNGVPLPFDLPDRALNAQLPGVLQPEDYLRVGSFGDVGADYFTNGQTSRVYIDGGLTIQSGRRININGNANELILVVTGDLYLEQNVEINGFIYVSGNLYFERSISPWFRTVVEGGLSLNGQSSDYGSFGFFAPNIQYRSPAEPLDGGNFCEAGDVDPPATAPDHYRLSFSSPALTCEAAEVTVEACADASCSTYSSVASSVFLSDSAGDWSQNPVAASPTATTQLSQTEAGTYILAIDDTQTTPGALNPPQCYVNGNFNAGCSITFNDTGLKFDSIGTQTSGNSFLTNLSVVRTNDNTQACEVVAEQVNQIEMGMHCVNPSSCSDFGEFPYAQMSVEQELINELQEDGSGGFSGWTPVAAGFDAGQEELEVQYGDAGKVSLRAKAQLPNGKVIEGVSNEFVYKPAVIEMAAMAANTYSDGIFAKAGEAFSVALQARNSSNQVTPNFGEEAPRESLNLDRDVEPVDSDNVGGALENASVFDPKDDNMLFSNDSVTYSEVGSAKVTAKVADADYLGAGPVTTEHTIGRFIPYEFQMEAMGGFTNTCGENPSAFYYIGQSQSLSPGFTLTAVNKSGQITENYPVEDSISNPEERGLEFYPFDKVFDDENELTSIELLSGELTPENHELNWNNGKAEFSLAYPTVIYKRSGAEEGPYENYSLGIQFNDGEGGNYYSVISESDLPAAGNAPSYKLYDSSRLLYGRVNLQDTYAAIGDQMPVIGNVEYWDGEKFVINEDDSCEKFEKNGHEYIGGSSFYSKEADDTDLIPAPAPVKVEASNDVTIERGELAPSSISVEALLRWESGIEGQELPNKPYTFDFKLNVPPYLKYEWDNDESDDEQYKDNPTAEGTFGIYRGRDRQIYWQEMGW